MVQDKGWVVGEFDGAELGDVRRSERLSKIVAGLASAPDCSLPHALGGEAELEGAYRFFSNSAVDYDAVLHPHVLKSGARCGASGEALVLHDTTDIRFECYGDVLRSGVTRLSANRQGFFLHTSLAVAADGSRMPLGVLAARGYVHQSDIEDEETRAFWGERGGLMDNEQERWLQSVLAAESVAGEASLIHVCDREGDAYELLGSLVELEHRFVIRLEHDRRVRDDNGNEMRLSEALGRQRWREGLTRTVKIQARYGEVPHGTKATTHKHKGRDATVSFRAIEVTLLRPESRSDLDYITAPTQLTVVEVCEVQPPDGVAPVRWWLATTEAVTTDDALLRVVDIYRTRWVVEEFFKAVKTGCAYEKRQLESARALLNMLAVTLPIAVHMLMLRDLAKEVPQMAATRIFDTLELMVMRALTSEDIVPIEATVEDALNAIARLGGHVRNNGPPGWLVLYRGYLELIAAKRGFRAAFEMMGQPLPEM